MTAHEAVNTVAATLGIMEREAYLCRTRAELAGLLENGSRRLSMMASALRNMDRLESAAKETGKEC